MNPVPNIYIPQHYQRSPRKNIRNNFLNGKKLFPELKYNNNCNINNCCPDGYISYHDVHNICDMDKELKVNLRKCRKLNCWSLPPEDNKRNPHLVFKLTLRVYRQMSGGRFLVSLRELLYSEIILACRSQYQILGRRLAT